jgi:hypothetical protein
MAVFTIRKGKNLLVRYEENRVGGFSPHHLVRAEMSSLPMQNEKLSWNKNQLPSVRNCGLTWEMCFNNLPITSV